MNLKKKVAIGMSGGVDSSVSALILKEQGYEVVGLFMKLWHDPCGTRQNACCDDKALADARLVADKIGIPFYEVDARKEFKQDVTDYFVDEYSNLRTPNPCVVCNKKIKFGWLLEFAEKLGCDFLATGHYVRVKGSDGVTEGPSFAKATDGRRSDGENEFHLLKGIDESKDQSYFLYQLNQKQLSKILFPVGEMTKAEVREIARKHDLPVSEKAESQEVCFISDGDYRPFVERQVNHESRIMNHGFDHGNIVDSHGNIIGKHDGLISYTIGQRKGIEQDKRLKTKDEGETKPLYVIGFDVQKNELIVGEDKDLWKSEFEIKDATFVSSKFKVESLKQNISVKIRYKATEIPCEISPLIPNTKYLIRLSLPARAITPGQSAVFYCGDEVIGGGIIC